MWKPALRKQPDGKTIPAAPWALSVKYGMGRWSMPSGTWYSLSNHPTNIFQEILICLNKINSKPTFMQLEKISEIEGNFEFSFLKRLLFGRDLKNNWASIQMNMGLLVWSNDEPFDFKVRLKQFQWNFGGTTRFKEKFCDLLRRKSEQIWKSFDHKGRGRKQSHVHSQTLPMSKWTYFWGKKVVLSLNESLVYILHVMSLKLSFVFFLMTKHQIISSLQQCLLRSNFM